VVETLPLDPTAPTVPSYLTATAVSSSQIDLSWTASSDPDDDAADLIYSIYRDGGATAIATVTGVTTYSDTGLAPNSLHIYTVDAADPANNRSDKSGAASATTLPTTATVTFTPVADAYVQADAPSTNYGTATTLKVDGSPFVNSYLRFTVGGLTGTVTKATLRIWANSNQTTGYDVFAVADTTWGETTITYSNAPPFGAKAGSSGKVTTGTWTSVDVTSLITGNGAFSLALSTTNTTNLSLASHESGANSPQLVVVTN